MADPWLIRVRSVATLVRQNTWNGIFAALGANSTIKIEHREPGMTHTVIQPEVRQMVAFVRG